LDGGERTRAGCFQAIEDAFDAWYTLNNPHDFFALRLIGNGATQLGAAILENHVYRVVMQPTTLPQMVNNSVGDLLIRGHLGRGHENLSAVELKSGWFLCRQGERQPKPCRSGEKQVGSSGHGNILLTVCALTATEDYSLWSVRGQRCWWRIFVKHVTCKSCGTVI
jgi:hypothetical protein